MRDLLSQLAYRNETANQCVGNYYSGGLKADVPFRAPSEEEIKAKEEAEKEYRRRNDASQIAVMAFELVTKHNTETTIAFDTAVDFLAKAEAFVESYKK